LRILPSSWTWALAGFLFVGWTVGAVFVGRATVRRPAAEESARKDQRGPDGNGKKLYARKEFENLVRGMTRDQLRATLGAPDMIVPESGPRLVDPGWYYYGITVNPRTQKPDETTLVGIYDGRATVCVFRPD
jgi:hypothetical protein